VVPLPLGQAIIYTQCPFKNIFRTLTCKVICRTTFPRRLMAKLGRRMANLGKWVAKLGRRVANLGRRVAL
jgi:hypothetical protein